MTDNSRFTADMVVVGFGKITQDDRDLVEEANTKYRATKGNENSGNHGHAGREGIRGGSAPSDEAPVSPESFEKGPGSYPGCQTYADKIFKQLPPVEEWESPKGRALTVRALELYGLHNRGVVVVAKNSDQQPVGLISYDVNGIEDADGNEASEIEIHLLAATGSVHGTGSELIKDVIRSNPGSSVRLVPDDTDVAKGFYTKIGMTYDGEGFMESFKFTPDQAKAFSELPKGVSHKSTSGNLWKVWVVSQDPAEKVLVPPPPFDPNVIY